MEHTQSAAPTPMRATPLASGINESRLRQLCADPPALAKTYDSLRRAVMLRGETPLIVTQDPKFWDSWALIAQLCRISPEMAELGRDLLRRSTLGCWPADCGLGDPWRMVIDAAAAPESTYLRWIEVAVRQCGMEAFAA